MFAKAVGLGGKDRGTRRDRIQKFSKETGRMIFTT